MKLPTSIVVATTVEFTGDARVQKPMVNVTLTREGVQLQMSPRRPF